LYLRINTLPPDENVMPPLARHLIDTTAVDVIGSWISSLSTASTTSVNPVADAYVQGGTAVDTNFGTAGTLIVKANFTNLNRESYLRFDLSAFNGTISSATLRLTPVTVDAGTVLNGVSLVSDDTWGETTITWNNKPAHGADTTTW